MITLSSVTVFCICPFVSLSVTKFAHKLPLKSGERDIGLYISFLICSRSVKGLASGSLAKLYKYYSVRLALEL